MLQSYKELIVWQKSIDLVEALYSATALLPVSEKFGISSQMRRAAISIPSNIAEGQRRKGVVEFLQFLRIADGSAAELETQVILMKRLYPLIDMRVVETYLEEVQKMLNVFIRKLGEKQLPLKTNNYKLKTNVGFTIIELMVAMSLFVIVVGITSGTFVRSLRTQRQLVALMAANDNASQTLEQMTREIRTGTAFAATGSRLTFTNATDERVAYDLSGNRIERNGKALTASNVLVKYLTFSVRGAEVGDGISTRVTVFLGVSAKGKMESFVTRLQTTVASRVLDG